MLRPSDPTPHKGLGPEAPGITVIMRTKNSQPTLVHALEGLFAQQGAEFELLVVDSGSTDETVSLLENYPCRLIRIRAEEYYPGPVLNRAIAASSAPIVVFQNSDVVPLGEHALERLVSPLLGGEADASFARQVPRPEADTWVRRDYDVAFPSTGPAPGWLPYSLPFAAMRRESWSRLPFYQDAWGSEDTHWGYRAREAGFRIRYVADAAVMHSHNYTHRQLFGRRFIEGEADAFIHRRPFSLAQAARGFVGSLESDLRAHLRTGDLAGLAASPSRRLVYHWAYLRGRRLGERRIQTGDGNASAGQAVVLERYEA